MKIKDIFEKNKFKETQGIIVGISGTGKQYNMEDFLSKIIHIQLILLAAFMITMKKITVRNDHIYVKGSM